MSGGREAAAALRLLRAADGEDQARVFRALPEAMRRALAEAWTLWAHEGQLPPEDEEAEWAVWLIRAGRGFGKTRAGAEWVQAYARANVAARIALVGGNAEDVRQVMIEGPSGLIATVRHGERWSWKRDRGEFVFDSGARAFVYSAAAPEGLRGPEHDAAWCDELAKWRYGDAAWDNLMMGMRRGPRPRVLVTTTPRPVPLMRRVMALRGVVETRGHMRDNPHLPAVFVAEMEAEYGASRLGRQELAGELVDDLENALWNRALLERQRVAAAPELVRVVVGVDPPAGTLTGRGGDQCGIVAVGRDADGDGYVLEDASVAGSTPEAWANAVVRCAERHNADRVVAEANQGGAMVETTLRAVHPLLPLRLVHAHRSKGARAEPVSALYEGGRMHHVGMFEGLEDQLCGMTPLGYEGPGRSPDRADALVWAVSHLMQTPTRRVGIRSLE